MNTVLQPMVIELREEAAATGRVLERVPGDKLSWKPHAKSMSLGQLAFHVATIPGRIANLVQSEGFDFSNANGEAPQPQDVHEIHQAFRKSVQQAEEILNNMTDEKASANWRMALKDKELFTKPRTSVLRSIMLNHWYHHRGQLTVYLRLLDVPVPIVYGRSADELPG